MYLMEIVRPQRKYCKYDDHYERTLAVWPLVGSKIIMLVPIINNNVCHRSNALIRM